VEMRGKTIGIVGLGRIGSGIAKRALAMEMEVLGYDPYINAAHAKAHNIELATLDKIWAKADFITLHMPLSKETKDLLNKDTFAKMKKKSGSLTAPAGRLLTKPIWRKP